MTQASTSCVAGAAQLGLYGVPITSATLLSVVRGVSSSGSLCRPLWLISVPCEL